MTDDPPAPRQESLDALISVVERVADDERARSGALTTKASTLTGFAGTTLAIVATLGRDAFKLDLGSIGDPLTRALFILSVVALAVSACLAGGALRARRRHLVAIAALRDFAGADWVTKDPGAIKHAWLVSLSETIGHDRANNDRRARLGEAAALALLIGLLAVAAQALILGVDALIYERADIAPIIRTTP